MAIVFYFQEFLDKSINAEQIKKKYFLYFADKYIVRELINQAHNTRQNYIENLNKALKKYFCNEQTERSFNDGDDHFSKKFFHLQLMYLK